MHRKGQRLGALGRVTVAGVTLLLGLAACASLVGVDGLEIGQCKGGICGNVPDDGSTLGTANDGAQGADADPDGSVGVDTGAPCPGTGGPPMVRAGSPDNSFCIDSTEVTVAQYRAFTNAVAGDAGGQPTACSWNKSYAPALGGADDLPQVGVDWCDALAFCKWAGKRLCGKVVAGHFVGPVLDQDLHDFAQHAWLVACSARGQFRYPYGSIVQPQACNLADFNAGKTLPVKSMSACVGGYPGLYDMLGNVWEWFDGPTYPHDAGIGVDAGDGGPAKDDLLVAGGAFTTPLPMECQVYGRGATRDTVGIDVGIRCCAE